LQNVSYEGAGPAGYAEAAFGDNLKDEAFCAQACSTAPFPLAASTVASDAYAVQASFETTSNAPSPYDWGLDLWFERSPSYQATPNPASDAEILIEPYNKGLPPPGCPSVPSDITAMISANGAPVTSSWNVCVGHGGAGVDLVTFELRSPTQSSTADITVPLGAFISAASSASGLNLSANYLMGIEFGTEYGSKNYGGAVNLNWRINSLLLTNSTSPSIPIVAGRS
jgi:hypothetical protein